MFNMNNMLTGENSSDSLEPKRRIQRIQLNANHILIVAPATGEFKSMFSWRLYTCTPRAEDKIPPTGLFARVTRHLVAYGYTFSRKDAIKFANRAGEGEFYD